MKFVHKNIGLYISLVVLLFVSVSCEQFVDIDAPKGVQDKETTFSNDGSATAAVLGLYAYYENKMVPLNNATGLAADERMSTNAADAEFLNNSITIENAVNSSSFWNILYAQIRNCNLAINAMDKSPTLSLPVKSQLTGEARFMRAYMYFNLLNLYGGVPLSLSAVGTENATLPRNTEEEVWGQIFTDLLAAKSLLKPEYPSADKARANKYAVSALLARAYLYHKEWAKAEAEATEVIESGVYSLSSPAATFKKGSTETILQLSTQTGRSSLVTNNVPANPAITPRYFLRPGFDLAFEKNSGGVDDARKSNWTGKNNAGIYYSYKYKVLTGSGDEYTILFRLAELYLIRAEARAQQSKLIGPNNAESDLNVIRTRAGLDNKLNLNRAAMLAAIEQERKVELFAEYMHRWFDLKRTAGSTDNTKTRADEVLSALKGAFWQPTDKLFPIPSVEIVHNPALIQNLGY
ncbi:RagB/SusD family nutrient uptake outer membrane protein [Solitalea lacus]|uniref:RagB/SusD family nutrient uptake outer membrane protein n=1 Tax=Solitalea lacus TaxID=2911172 RepID=UPI001EDBD13C|nr:RagB/SusD family nutrient uptake outer membrane protein [Solitalea lacus]UKJ06963.1 RagB/SusD family nutrient uptake outer membrane protein [Solitalea lacus]